MAKMNIMKQMDTVTQTEVLLNMVNTLLAKAMYFHDSAVIRRIHDLQHQVYYGNYEYDSMIAVLQEIRDDLKRYDAF